MLESRTITFLLELVQVDELVTSPPELPFTRVAVTANGWGVPLTRSNDEVGLTDMLPTEVGETKKLSQALKVSISPSSPQIAMKAMRLVMNFPLKS
jgi:hypothetical protein